jgi:hypothetical protein
MPGIDLDIFVHEIKTYPRSKPVRQRLLPVHPRKVVAIKLDVEKLLKARFIYLVALTEWVSNPVPIDKKGGSIRVCVAYRDINKACPKENFPTPFVDQIVDDCAGSEIFSLINIAIVKLTLLPRTNIKLLLYVLGVLFPIGNSPSVLRMLA